MTPTSPVLQNPSNPYTGNQTPACHLSFKPVPESNQPKKTYVSPDTAPEKNPFSRKENKPHCQEGNDFISERESISKKRKAYQPMLQYVSEYT